MSYFGVSNPELNSPFYGIGAAKRGRARAQRKRFTHTQMAGRNGGFADPREIMAYHNKGELSDGATIQALSLFGIGAAGARKMIGDSHRSRQHAAMMGLRRQQAAFRSMGSHDGTPDNIRVLAYEDRNGGNWSIEINQVGAHIGVGTTCHWRIKSVDSDNPMYNVWVKRGTAAQFEPAKFAAQAAIEELVEDAPQDYVVDEFGENYQDSLASFPRWSLWYYTQYTGGQISWVNWEISSQTLNLSYTGQAETKAAARVAALDAVDAWVATQQVNNDGGGDATGGNGGDATGNGFPDGVPSNAVEYNGYYYEVLESAFAIYSPEGEVLVVTSGYTSLNAATAGAMAWINSEIAGENPPRGNQTVQPTTETFTFQHTSVPDMPSTWTIVVDKHVSGPPLYFTNYRYTASSSEWEFGISSSTFENHGSVESAKAAAEEKIHNSVMQSIAINNENGNGNGNGAGTGENGNGNGVPTSDLSDYTSAQDVIDGHKLGVISYREAHNALTGQFAWSENEATAALITEESSNNYYISDTDGDSFRETGVDNAQPLQIQTQEVAVVPSGPSFIEENKVALAGGAILVAGAAAMAYSNRRN